MTKHVKDASGGKRLVGISGTYLWALAEWPLQLAASEADWVSPTNYTGNETDPGGFRTNPPATYQGKLTFLDTDHLWGTFATVDWVWKSFLRGYHVLYMENGRDCFTNTPTVCHADIRAAIGATVFQAKRAKDLAAMTPQPTMCSSGFCLVNSGQEYIVYQPNEATVTMNSLPIGIYSVESYCDTSTNHDEFNHIEPHWWRIHTQ